MASTYQFYFLDVFIMLLMCFCSFSAHFCSKRIHFWTAQHNALEQNEEWCATPPLSTATWQQGGEALVKMGWVAQLLHL